MPWCTKMRTILAFLALCASAFAQCGPYGKLTPNLFGSTPPFVCTGISQASSGGPFSTGVVYSGTVTFGAPIADGVCASSTYTATGLAAGTTLIPNWSNLPAGLTGNVKALTDAVSVSICNFTGVSATPSFAMSVSTSSAGQPVSATPNQNLRTVGSSFGDYSASATAMSTAQIAHVHVPFSGVIQSVVLDANAAGSAIIDVRTHTGTWTGCAAATSITASAIPTLSSAITYSDLVLTGWNKTIAADTDVCFYLTSPSTLTGVDISLKVLAN